MATITMTTAKTSVKIVLKGSDRVKINWGDSKNEEYTISTGANTTCTHTYTSTAIRTITISYNLLTHLDCAANDLTALDLSNNMTLEHLWCQMNKLTFLNLIGCRKLLNLYCHTNSLASLDLAGMANLINLEAQNNKLTSLTNLNTCPKLETIWVHTNNLTALNLAGLVNLTYLDCYKNKIKTISNLSVCSKLGVLWCNANELSSLDIGALANLTNLRCSENPLTSLANASACAKLDTIWCYNNKLTSLTVNSTGKLIYLDCKNNVLNATALNNLFASLPTVASGAGAKLFIAGNAGASSTGGCNTATATGKRWALDYTTPAAPPFIAVTNITAVPTSATVGTPLALHGAITPATATNKTITWSVVSAGTTGATISGNSLSARTGGTVTVRATVVKGASATANYTKDFSITVTASINTELAKIAYNENNLYNMDSFCDNSPPKYVRAPDDEGILRWGLQEKPIETRNRNACVHKDFVSRIYPGALLKIDYNLTTGRPNIVTLPSPVKRGPIRIYCNAISNTATLIPEASAAKVSEAVGNIKRTLISKGHRSESAVTDANTYTSSKELGWSVGLDTGFLGFNTSTSCDINQKENSFYVAVTDIERYFTVHVAQDEWAGDPSVLFGAGATWGSISNAIGANSIAMVTSVTYGRTCSFIRKYKSRDYTFNAKTKIDGSKFELNVSRSLSENESHEETVLYDTGGSEVRSAILASDQTQGGILRAISSHTNTFRVESQGQPIEFTIALITGPAPGRIIQPKYNLRYYANGYKYHPNRLILDAKKISAYNNLTGAAIRPICDCSFFKVNLAAQTETIVRASSKATIVNQNEAAEGLEADFMNHSITGYDTSIYKIKDAPANAYFKNIKFRLRYKSHLTGSYSTAFTGYIDDKSFQDGKVHIRVGGSYTGPKHNSASETKLDGRVNR